MSLYDSSYYNAPKVVSGVTGSLIWTIIALVLAFVGGITLYFTVFNKKNESKYKGFMAVLYDLVHFRYFVIDDLARIFYIVSALAVTLLSFNFIGKWQFLVMLLGGNLALRITYEFMMLFINLCHDVRDINSKTKK